LLPSACGVGNDPLAATRAIEVDVTEHATAVCGATLKILVFMNDLAHT